MDLKGEWVASCFYWVLYFFLVLVGGGVVSRVRA